MEQERNEKINQIDEKIKDLLSEKLDLQKDCPHKECVIKFAPNTTIVKKFCKACNVELGYPSEKEISDFLKDR